MTNLEIINNQLELLLEELQDPKSIELDLIYDYAFEAQRLLKNLSISEVLLIINN